MDIPGFVDLQVNGFCGVDFSSPELSEEDFLQSCHHLLQKGTCAFLPTVITSPLAVYRRNLPIMSRIMELPELKNRVLGFHLEGPFISPLRGVRGIHNPRWIKKPDIQLLEHLIELSGRKIKLLTIAAGIEDAEELTRYAIENRITVSLGHYLATMEEVTRLVDAGATAHTHLGNGIPEMIHRHHNPIWIGLAQDGLSAMIISDGHHLPYSLLKTIIRAKGASKIIVTSDASPLAGLAPGRYRSMGWAVILEESGLLHSPNRGCLAGSSRVMLECMNVLSASKLLELPDLVKVGFSNPLKLIGIDPGLLPKEKLLQYDEGKKGFLVR